MGVAGTAFALLGGQSVAPLPSPPLPADARSITGQRISVDRVQQRLAGKGVLVVGIDVREDAGKARDFARDNHLTYPIMTDDGRMEKQYRAWAYPLVIIIDQRAGTIQRLEGERDDLEARIGRVVDGRE